MFRRLFISLLLAARLAAAEPVLDTVAKIHALPPDEAARGLPARVEGVVTYYDPQKSNLYVQDATGGIYVSMDKEEQELHIQAGDRLRIEGKTRRPLYGFSNDIIGKSIRRVGKGPLPDPLRPGEDELLSPALDCQWVEVSAVVVGVESRESAEQGGISFTLNLEIHGWKMEAVLPHDDHADQSAASLMQRPVRLRGVAATIFNENGQMTGRYFFVPSFDQIIPTSDAVPAAQVPLRKANDLLRYEDTAHTLVRIRGVITQATENGFYLRDETGGTLVQTSQKGPFVPGTRVEAEGFATIAPFRPFLRARKIAVLGEAEKPVPLALDPGRHLSNKELFALQADLVAVEADFIARRDGTNETVLQCRSGDYYFEAILPNTGLLPENLTAGDRIRLTGICELTTIRPRSRNSADGIRLHLAKEGGVVILRRAPWWTPEHLLVILVVVSAVALMSLAWVWLLRFRVRAQTEIIGGQIQKAAVYDERQRIARELHDTVEQELSGLSTQLGNISRNIKKSPVHAEMAVQLARKMLRHCREESRASIRDLRSIELEQWGLSSALHELLPVVLDGCGAAFELRVSGEPRPLDAIAERHLLRIAQESVANAASHSGARTITVHLDYTPDDVALTIGDDGRGFDLDAPAPIGHFGLLGIRERANKMQSALDIESVPGKGTTIRVVVPASNTQKD